MDLSLYSAFWRYLLFLFAFLIPLGASQAGEISLTLKATIDAHTDKYVFTIEIGNQGNESCYEVNPVVWLHDKPQQLNGTSEIIPGHNLQAVYQTPKATFPLEGTYYLPVMIHYKDMTGMHFKIPYVFPFANAKNTVHGLKFKANPQPLDLGRDKHLKLTLENLDTWDKQIKLRSYPSMSIDMKIPIQEFVLRSNEQKTWQIPIHYSNLWPSTFFNYFVAEYDHENRHYAENFVAQAVLTPDFGIYQGLLDRRILWALLGIGCLGIISALLWSILKNKT